MRFSPPDEDIKLYKSCFKDDLLGRSKISKKLSDVLERIEDPLVVALDGRWGTGKSYFLKRWVGAHCQQNDGRALTIYFDAFAHDYLSDPLISLVAALSERVPPKEEPKLNRIRKAAFRFIKPAARLGLALATYGATEALSDIGDVTVEVVKGEAERVVDDFWKLEQGRQAAMEEFRAAITALTQSDSDQKTTPLIIVIDELDRCRPDYSLEVLEVIKHFFSVPKVHFILGVNLIALENSIKVRYGADIDATSYLQKFLSFTLSLPDHIGDQDRTPSVIHYATHLGTVMNIPNHLLNEILIQLKMISKSNHISIRDVGKIMSNVSILSDEPLNEDIYLGYKITLITMIITKIIRPELLSKLINLSIKDEEIVKYFSDEKQYINENLDNGVNNLNYDYDISLRYDAWKFLCLDGALDDNEVSSSLSSAFGRPRQIKKIPQKIFEDWMNVFKLS